MTKEQYIQELEVLKINVAMLDQSERPSIKTSLIALEIQQVEAMPIGYDLEFRKQAMLKRLGYKVMTHLGEVGD